MSRLAVPDDHPELLAVSAKPSSQWTHFSYPNKIMRFRALCWKLLGLSPVGDYVLISAVPICAKSTLLRCWLTFLRVKRKLYVPRVEDKNSHLRMLHISSVDDIVANSMDILEPAVVDADGNEREDGNVSFPVVW